MTALAREVLERAQDVSGVVGARRIRGQAAANLAGRLVIALEAGWTRDDLVVALTGSFESATTVAGAMGHRVDNVLDGDPPTAGTEPPRPPVVPMLPWCGECDSDAYRWRHDGPPKSRFGTPEPSWRRCPECNPLARTTAA